LYYAKYLAFDECLILFISVREFCLFSLISVFPGYNIFADATYSLFAIEVTIGTKETLSR